jgi:hypothetical protein
MASFQACTEYMDQILADFMRMGADDEREIHYPQHLTVCLYSLHLLSARTTCCEDGILLTACGVKEYVLALGLLTGILRAVALPDPSSFSYVQFRPGLNQWFCPA